MDIDIKRNGSRPSTKGSPDWFTGLVRVDPLFQAPNPARVGAGHVTFEPGARTNWHTHPLGQTLIITSGLGWVQPDGGPIEEVRPGDVVRLEGEIEGLIPSKTKPHGTVVMKWTMYNQHGQAVFEFTPNTLVPRRPET